MAPDAVSCAGVIAGGTVSVDMRDHVDGVVAFDGAGGFAEGGVVAAVVDPDDAVLAHVDTDADDTAEVSPLLVAEETGTLGAISGTLTGAIAGRELGTTSWDVDWCGIYSWRDGVAVSGGVCGMTGAGGTMSTASVACSSPSGLRSDITPN